MNNRMLKQRLRPDLFEQLLKLKVIAQEKMVALPTTSLRKLAAAWAHRLVMSGGERLKLVKKLSVVDRGGMSVKKALEQLNIAANSVNAVLMFCRYYTTSQPSLSKSATLEIRHENRVRAAVKKCYESVIRISVNNTTTINMNSATPVVLVKDYYKYGYKGQHSRRPMHCFETCILLPPLWYSRVYQRNIACLGRYFVVDARVLYTTVTGVCVLEADAAKNDRGCIVRMHKIHIAITKTGVAFYEDKPALFVKLPRVAADKERCMLSAATKKAA